MRVFAVLWLSGCTAAAPGFDAGVADGGSVVVDAGSTGDAGADAGVPVDAGPREPVLAASVLYREPFEYTDENELKASYPIFRELGGRLLMDTTLDQSRSMQIDYQPSTDGGCADAEVFVGKLVAGDVPEVISTWSFKLRDTLGGFLYVQPSSHCGGRGTGSTEWVLLRPGDPAGRISLEVSAEPENPVRNAPAGVSWRVSIEDAFPTAPRKAVYAQQFRVGTHGPLALTQSVFHRVTLAVTRESGVGQGDGVLQLWVDGALVMDVQDAATGPAPFSALRYPTSLRSGASRAQSRWLDDVVLFAR